MGELNIKRQQIDNEVEFELLGSMITSKEVMAAAFDWYKKGELKRKHFSKYYRPLFDILIEFYETKKTCPGSAIQKVFATKSNAFDEDILELVEAAIDRMADAYEESSTEEDYICQEMLPGFIREKTLHDKIDKIQGLLDQGRLSDAEKILSEYKPISVLSEEEENGNFGMVLPFTETDIDEAFDEKNITDTIAYNFPGDIGRMLGPLRKSWLVAVTGIEKSGKSYLLNEIAYDASINHNMKVLYINIELAKALARLRNYRRISKTASEKSLQGKLMGKRLYIPIFDCMNNQRGTCGIKNKQVNRQSLVLGNEAAPVGFHSRPDWKICTECRGAQSLGTKKTERFIPAIWWTEGEKIRPTNKRRVKAAINKYSPKVMQNYHIKCFPSYSVTFDECERFIDNYIEKNDWHPDIIIFDYLDILYEDESRDRRLNIDENWKKAKRLAATKNCLVLTADQANKDGRTTYRLDAMSTSESKTKDAHLDVRMAINKTDEEKAMGVARLNTIFHRHESYDIRQDVLVTQRIATSEPYMDSHFEEGWKKHFCCVALV